MTIKEMLEYGHSKKIKLYLGKNDDFEKLLNCIEVENEVSDCDFYDEGFKIGTRNAFILEAFRDDIFMTFVKHKGGLKVIDVMYKDKWFIDKRHKDKIENYLEYGIFSDEESFEDAMVNREKVYFNNIDDLCEKIEDLQLEGEEDNEK